MAHKGFNKHAAATAALADRHKEIMEHHHKMEVANTQWLNYGGASGFGGADEHAHTVFAPGKRRRINIVGICLNTFFPFWMFSSLYCAMSFKFHYMYPFWAWAMCAIYCAISGLCCLYARRARYRDREPRWLFFSAGAVIFAVISATVFGNLNYRMNLLPYYEINSLNTYPAVDPAKDFGQEKMDAGRAYFADGAKLDMKMATSFKNTDLFCVAPIVNGDEKLDHYDFWAVGVNCCSGVSPDFRCGQFNNPKARSGIRSVDEAERPYYRLAVQMAAAQFNLNAPHPLFFTWIQDPIAELEHYLNNGWRYFLLGVSCHFAFNLFCALSATVLFSKIDYNGA